MIIINKYSNDEYEYQEMNKTLARIKEQHSSIYYFDANGKLHVLK